MNCAGCEDQAQEREAADRWSDSLRNVLAHDEGRLQFRKYLTQAGFLEDLDTLQFWEDCEALLFTSRQLLAAVRRLLLLSPSLDERETKRKQFAEDSRKLVDFANESINLDVRELQELSKVVSGPDEALKVLPLAKQSAFNLLEAVYLAFRESIIRAQSAITY